MDFRYYFAHLELIEFEQARSDVKKALDLDPENKPAKVTAENLAKKQKEFDDKEKKKYANLFK